MAKDVERAKVVQESIARKKKEANFREWTRCCNSCAYLDQSDGDGSPYSSTPYFCGCPKNEWNGALPGEEYTWTIECPSSSVCKHWKEQFEW